MGKIMNTFKQRPDMCLGCFLGVSVVMILIGYIVLQVPIVPVCTIVILEALLSALLNRIPLWVHGLVVIAQIVAGIVFGETVFMILMVVVYITAVALLYFWTCKEA